MGNTTAIEWTRSEDGTAGSTWNPVSGCTKLSPGCDHCYAENIAHRFSGTKAYPNGFDVTLWPARLDQPIRWTRPRKIFVNSTSDLFHKDIPDEYIAKVWAVMAATPRHTFQILTKRPARMRSLLRSSRFRRQVGDAARALDLTNDLVSIVDVAVQDLWPLENVWLASRPRTKNGPTSVSLNYSQPPRQSDSSPPNHFSVRSSCGRSSYPTRTSAGPTAQPR